MLEPDPENKGSPGRASSSFQSGLGQPLTNPVAGSSKSSQPIASSSSLPSRPGNVGIVDDQSSRAASPSNFIRGFQVNSPTTEIGREGETSRNDSPSNVTRRTRKQKRHQSNLDINNNSEDSDSESDTGSVQEEKFELWADQETERSMAKKKLCRGRRRYRHFDRSTDIKPSSCRNC